MAAVQSLDIPAHVNSLCRHAWVQGSHGTLAEKIGNRQVPRLEGHGKGGVQGHAGEFALPGGEPVGKWSGYPQGSARAGGEVARGASRRGQHGSGCFVGQIEKGVVVAGNGGIDEEHVPQSVFGEHHHRPADHPRIAVGDKDNVVQLLVFDIVEDIVDMVLQVDLGTSMGKISASRKSRGMAIMALSVEQGDGLLR